MFDLELAGILVIIFLVVIAALFSGAETALTSLKRTKMKDIENENPNLANYLKMWIKRPNEMMTTMLIGGNIASIFSVSVATILVILFLKKTIFEGNYPIIVLLSTVIMGTLLLVFGEIAPKIAARNNCEKTSKAVIIPIYYLSIILSPIVYIFSSLSILVVKFLGVKIKKDEYLITEDDIRNLLDVGEEVGVIETEEKKMIHGIFEFGDVNVSNVMVPRTKVYSIDGSVKIGEVWRDIVKNGYSRIPVYDNTIDNIIGIVYLKDIIPYVGKKEFFHIPIRNIIRHAFFVPSTKFGSDLLKEFREKKVHMAIVVDEYGGTLGIVTIEDLLEEIVGEINDEYDTEEEYINKLDESNFKVNPLVNVSDLNERLGINIPESDEYDTLSGFIYSSMGRIPVSGDQVVEEDVIFKITSVDKNKIVEVHVNIFGKDQEKKEVENV